MLGSLFETHLRLANHPERIGPVGAGALGGFGVARRVAFVPIKAVVGNRHVRLENGAVVGNGKVGVEEEKAIENGCFKGVDSSDVAVGLNQHLVTSVGNSTNIKWHECPVGKSEREKLLQQKGCVVWITGLSGSGKSTLACALSRELYCRGFLSYILDGDNLRHGLNRDLGFKAEDRAENIRRTGEVAKLFADSGIICIASLISPYHRDRDACRALHSDGNFIEVFMDMPLELCEARDSKGLYKLARAGKIKGFTGVDDPYEPPLNSEIVIKQKNGACPSPTAMAEEIIAYLEKRGYLKA